MRGEHLTAIRTHYQVGPDFDAEVLHVVDIDDDGRFRFSAVFDADDLTSAVEELDDRYLTTLPPDVAATFDLQRRFLQHYVAGDVAAVAALLAPAYEFVDRQPLGFGTLDREANLEVMAAARHQPGYFMFAEEILAISEQGTVVRTHEFEANSSGGHVEQRSLIVSIVRGGLVHRIEYFPPDDVDAALARYAELANAPGSPENLATRALAAWDAGFANRDWDAMRSMCVDDHEYVDHRRVVGGDVRIGADESVAGTRGLVDFGAVSFESIAVAVRGEHLAVSRELVRTTDMEVEVLQFTELDAGGRFQRRLVFDPDDVTSAIRELDDRYAATLAPPVAVVHDVQRRYLAAYVAGDVVAAGALLGPSFEFVDRQPLGFGTLDRDGTLEVMAMARHQPGYVMFAEEILAIGARGSVVRTREQEANSSGGHVEQHSVVVSTVSDGRIDRIEFFPDEEADAALARYRDLTGR